jgi:hypothetical protein
LAIHIRAPSEVAGVARSYNVRVGACLQATRAYAQT